VEIFDRLLFYHLMVGRNHQTLSIRPAKTI
jgi:hypothetical protein